MCLGEAQYSSQGNSSRLRAHHIEPGGSEPTESRGLSRSLRRPGEGCYRTGVVRGIHPDAFDVSCTIDRNHRRRGQHDRGHDEDGRITAKITKAGERAADSTAGTAADERGIGQQGETVGGAKRRGGAEESGNRTSTARAGG